MRRLTLIAYYQRKPEALETLILACQQYMAQLLGDAFAPYPMAQVHATLLGLDHLPNSDGVNANFWQHRRLRVRMEVPGYLKRLERDDRLPMTLQIGGYDETFKRFTSRGRLPHERSVSIQGDKVVLMGWPVPIVVSAAPTVYPNHIHSLRDLGARYGVLHKYLLHAGDVDNDLYMRIGIVDREAVSAQGMDLVQAELRAWLGARPATVIELALEDLSLASFLEEHLPLESTQSRCILDTDAYSLIPWLR